MALVLRYRERVFRQLVSFGLLLIPLGAPLDAAAEPPAVIESRQMRLAVGGDGRVVELTDKQTGKNFAAEPRGPLASVKTAGKLLPVSAVSVADGQWRLTFGESGVQAVLRPMARDRHVVLEVVSLAHGTDVEEFVFLDIPLSLRGTPGEPFAACALALNLKTKVAELPGPGSRLRASAVARFGFEGAAAAIVACPPGELRDGLQAAVSAAPDLPHSPLGGPWALDAPLNRGSYLFNFDGINEASADAWIALARSLGLTQIDFHGGGSFRFGDCRPNPARYPQGRANLQATLDKLHAAGLSAGLHTYAFFIAKDCPWVTPVPDPRLAADAAFTLAAPLSADGDSLSVAERTADVSTITGFFVRNSVTLRIDEELITYTGVRQEAPFGFSGCRRGACGTRPAPHAQGAKVQHLKECFGLFVPDPESTLFAEVAAAAAETFNDCGFDMIYFDALDGEDILGGAAYGWHYGAQFVYEVWRRLKKPALIEMSTFHHHLWCVRSRYCAWDHPVRSHKRFIDAHDADNEHSRRMFLPGELGWWALKSFHGPQGEPTFADDIEYLMTKGLATDTGFALMGIDPTTAKQVPALPRLAGIIKRYEDLRHAGQVPDTIKSQLRQAGAEFTLVGDIVNGWQFIPVAYAKHRVEDAAGPSAAWSVENKFAAQPLRLRIEALMSAGPYDAPGNPLLADFQEPAGFATRNAQTGVSAELKLSTEQVKAAAASGCYSAVSNHAAPRAAWSQMEKRFEPPLNLSGHQALGVWIHGDAQGQILNVQLRCLEHLVGNLADHYIPIDFAGWRYFELIEPEGSRWSDYQWPYGNLYAIYREEVQRGQLNRLGLWYNNLPTGKPVTCYLSPIKALPLVKGKLLRPSVTIGEATVTFPVEIETGCYLECLSPADCRLYGPHGELLQTVTPDGPLPQLKPGANAIQFHGAALPNLRARAYVTLITQGDPLPK